MSNKLEISKNEEKDHFNLTVNGVDHGKWEKSELRQAIETIDNEI